MQISLRFLLLPALLLATPGSATQEPDWRLDKLAPQAQEQLRNAYAEFQANPDSADSAGQLALFCHAYEAYDEAAEYYEVAHSLDRDEFRWAYYLGVVRANLGLHEEALPILRRALRLRSDYLPAQFQLAESLQLTEELEESEQVYREILLTSPNSASAHYGLGRVKAAQKDLQAATGHYRQACSLYPNYGAAHYALALAYRDLGQLDKAREHLSLYREHATDEPPRPDPLLAEVWTKKTTAFYYLERGAEADSVGRSQAAIDEHVRALELDPTMVAAHVNLITLYGRQGRYADAEKHYRAVLQINPDSAEAHYNFAVILTYQERFEEAAALFQKAVEINPYYPEAHNNLGSLLFQAGRLDDALEHFLAALRERPNHRLAHFNVGRILVHKKQYQEAIHHFQRTLTPVDQETPRFLYALAVAHARSGDYQTAVERAKEARDQAAGLGQTELVSTIEKDLNVLEKLAGNP